MFLEASTTQGRSWWWFTTDAIPPLDNNYADVHTQGQNGDGSYTVSLFVNSSYWNAFDSAGINTGQIDYKGTAHILTENTYRSGYGGIYRPYSGYCNTIGDNGQTNARVSTAISTYGTWSSWGSSESSYQNPPYSILVNTYTTFFESGG
jgi:hypothetical protein